MRLKPLAILVIGVLMSSCAATPLYYEYNNATDLSSYNNEGMFITTGDYTKDYDPIGIISSESSSGFALKSEIKSGNQSKVNSRKDEIAKEDIYTGSKPTTLLNSEYKKCTVESAIEKAVEKAKEMGANAIINLAVTPTYFRHGSSINLRINVTGMAIKRK